MPQITHSVWGHGEASRKLLVQKVSSCGLCGGEKASTDSQQKRFCNLQLPAWFQQSLLGVGAAGTDREMQPFVTKGHFWGDP